MYDVEIGPTSNDIYTYSRLQDSLAQTFVGITREESNDTLVWSNIYQGNGAIETFTVDSAENYIYYVVKQSNVFELAQIYANNGTLI